jgi:hypothetical protein
MSIAVNEFDDQLLISIDNSRKEQPADNTCRPDLPPAQRRGYDFKPLTFADRNPRISTLPETPLNLFQLFLPEDLVSRWADYTNKAAASGASEGSRSWKPTSASELYLYIGFLIYAGIHKEVSFEAYWAVSSQGSQIPLHPVVKFMSYDRFNLLNRWIRIYSEEAIAAQNSVPKNFKKVSEWSDQLQEAATTHYKPGTHIAVDECMIRYEGRLMEKVIPSKPIPEGFKAWAAAQHGYFLRWIFHTPATTFGPVGKPATRRSRRAKGEIYLNPTQ